MHVHQNKCSDVMHCVQEAFTLRRNRFYEGKSVKLTSIFFSFYQEKKISSWSSRIYLIKLYIIIYIRYNFAVLKTQVVIFSKWQLALQSNECVEKLVHFAKDKRLSVACAGNKSAQWDALTIMLTCVCGLWIASKPISLLQPCQLKLSDAF